MKTCSDCTMWVPDQGSSKMGICRCNPVIVRTHRTHWCGQHRGKAGRPVKSAKPLEKKA